MKLAPRFALAFSVTASVVLGCYGVLDLRRERVDLMASTEREVRTLAKAVQVSVHDALRDGQNVDVLSLFDGLEQMNAEIDLALMRPDGTWDLSDRKKTTLDPDVERAMKIALTGQSATFLDPDLNGNYVIAEPVMLAASGPPAASVAVIRSLDDVRADLVRTRDRIVLTVTLTLLLLTLVAVGVAQWMVARPLSRLVAVIDRVRAGNLGEPALSDAGADEIGETTRRFNAMVADLGAARRRLDEAEADRGRLMRTLEHADKLVTVGQLAAGVAHEVGTPLHVLVGRARSLEQRADDPAEVRRISKIVVEQVTRISRIVEQLLRSARRRPPDPRRIDVRAPVTAVIELLAFEARRKNVSLQFDAGSDVPAIFADADQVQQMVLNLVRNAIAAVPEKGAVTVAVRRDTLHAAGRADEACVCISVKDTGEGMNDDVKARVFDPFFTTRADGTGLGLPVVRSLVLAHRGTIDVDSAPGKGTEVSVRLPIEATAPSASTASSTDASHEASQEASKEGVRA